MAYGTLYYTTFTSEDSFIYTIEINEEDYLGTSTELQAGVSPIVITQSDGDILNTVIGSGASINLISETSLQLINLYTDNILKYQINLKRGSNIVWTGWLSSEMYEEVYSEYSNYNISFLATDGIALLNTIDYLDTNGDFYTGFDTAQDIITNIIGKVSELRYLHIADLFEVLDKTNNALTLNSNESILNKIFINQSNFYDETSTPMKCRKVLESILQPLGAILRTNPTFTNNYTAGFYIYDNNVILRNATQTFKIFQIGFGFISSWTYYSTSYIYDLENNLEYKDTGSALNITNLIQSQRIIYSPYKLDRLLDATMQPANFEDSDDPNVDSKDLYGSGCTEGKWTEILYKTNPQYEMIATQTDPIQEVRGWYVDGGTIEGIDYYIKTPVGSSGLESTLLFKTSGQSKGVWGNGDPALNDFSKWALLVNFKVMIDSKYCFVPLEGTNQQYTMEDYVIGLQVSIGSVDTILYAYMQTGSKDAKMITNQYYSPSTRVDSKTKSALQDGALIEISNMSGTATGGNINIYVTKHTTAIVDNVDDKFRFKDFTVDLVQVITDKDGNPSYKKVEFNDEIIEGDVSVLSKNEGSDLTMLLGTLTAIDVPERGALLYENPNYPASYYMFGINKIHKYLTYEASDINATVEDYMLNKIMSNYAEGRVKLSNISVKASDIDSFTLARITDTNQFPNKIMMISGYEYDYYADKIILTLLEIVPDNINIT